MKKLVLTILLIMPFFVNAEDTCDKEKHKEYVNLSSSITYDNNFSLSANAFTITLYNVFDGMYAKYNDKKYTPSSDNIITIKDIKGGEKVFIDIFANDNCTAVKRIIVNEPYYNKYYGSKECNGYENKLVMCSSQFTSVEVTKSRLEKAIYNYNHNISQQTTKEEEPKNEVTFISKLTQFLTKWGIRIILAIISTILSISLFSDKYRKVKHGI